MALSDDDRRVLEKTNPVYTAMLVDENDAPIALTSISAITLTYYDRRTGTLINSRDAQDVKNANNVTIHATSGLLTWTLQVADTSLAYSASFAEDEVEEHVALFQWTLTNGKVGKFLTRFFIIQLLKVT